MGKDHWGKELGEELCQQEDGIYVGRYTNKYGNRVQKVLPKLQEVRQWLTESQYQDEYSNIDFPLSMTVNAWFEYGVVSRNEQYDQIPIRNYTEWYHHNIEHVIGKKMFGAVNSIHCQTIMNRMADEGYQTTAIYQTWIALYNMLEYADLNDVIMKNPCSKVVKSDIGKTSKKRKHWREMYDVQRTFCKIAEGMITSNSTTFYCR